MIDIDSPMILIYDSRPIYDGVIVRDAYDGSRESSLTTVTFWYGVPSK